MAESIGLRAIIDLKNFNKGLTTYNKGINQMNKKTSGFTSKATKSLGSLGGSLLKFGALAGGVALVGIGALGVGIAALGTDAITSAISFESAFTGVTKTIDDLSDATGKLSDLGKEIRGEFEALSTIIPATFEEIAAVGEIGGQLGVGAASITDFTETIIQLRDTTNLTAESAATDLARIGNIYQVTSEQIGENTIRAGAAIVALGNEFATSEGEIVSFATRIAGAGQVVGLTQASIFGIGAAFSAVGVPAERGGTAVQKALLAINSAVNAGSTGFTDFSKKIDSNVSKMSKLQAESARLEAQFPGLQSEILAQKDAFIAAGGQAEDFGRLLGDKTRQKALETAESMRTLKGETELLRQEHGKPIDSGQLAAFAKVAGVTSVEFAEAWETDAAGAFQSFIEGLAREGDDADGILKELGLGGERVKGSFLALASAGDLLDRTLETANTGFEEGTALQKEAAKRYATTESQIQILKNTFRLMSATVGTSLLPILSQVIAVGKGLIEKFAGPLAAIIDNVVVPAIDNFIDTIGSLITTFQTGGLFGTQDPSGGGQQGLLSALGIPPDFIAIIENVFDTISTLVSSFLGGGLFGDGEGGGFLEALGLSPEIISILEGIVDTISNTISGLATGELDLFSNLINAESFGEAIGLIISFIPGQLQILIDNISQFLTDNWPTILAVLQTWADNFFSWVNETVVPGIPDFLTDIITAITDWATEQLPIIQASTQEWATGFWEWVQGVVSSASASLAGIVAAIGLWAASPETQTQLTAMGVALGEALVVGIQNLAENQEQMVSILTQIVSGLAIGALAVIGLLAAIGAQILAGIIAGIVESLGGGEIEVAMITELPAILADIGTNMLTAAKVIGLDIILGIIGGLEDGLDQLITTVLQIGTIISETVKSALGISSPSTLFFGFGVDIIQGLIDGIISLASTLPDILSGLFAGIGDIFGSLFGGGEDEAEGPGITPLAFDPAEMLAGIESVNLGIAGIDLALNNITLITLPLLTEIFTVTITLMIEQLLLLLTTGIMPVDLALVTMHSITLPTFQAVMLAVAAASVTALIPLQDILNVLISLITELTKLTEDFGKAAQKAGKDAAKGFKDAAKALENQLIPAMRSAMRVAEELALAMEKVVQATKKAGKSSKSVTGMGFAKGIGFQAGTPSNTGGALGLGFKIPPGFPNDSFPMRVTSGEEALITPRGTSIEGLIFSRLANLLRGTAVQGGSVTNHIVNNFQMNVQTSSTPQAVTRQFEVMQGFVGT